MPMKVLVNNFISIEELCKVPALVRFLSYRCFHLAVPTEFVVTEGYSRIVSPNQARAFKTELFYYNDEVMTYNQLRQLPGFSGSSHYSELFLFEYWEDEGSDGHVAFTHRGYILTHEIKEFNKYPERQLDAIRCRNAQFKLPRDLNAQL